MVSKSTESGMIDSLQNRREGHSTATSENGIESGDVHNASRNLDLALGLGFLVEEPSRELTIGRELFGPSFQPTLKTPNLKLGYFSPLERDTSRDVKPQVQSVDSSGSAQMIDQQGDEEATPITPLLDQDINLSGEDLREDFEENEFMVESQAPEDDERARISAELHDGDRVEMAITVFRTPDVVYSFWRDFSNVPKFMTHVKAIDVVSDTRMNWHWRTIGNVEFTWEAEIIDDVPDKVISWRTLPGTSVQHAGSVWFKPALSGEATEVFVRLMYKAPGGKLLKGLAEIFHQAPEQVLRDDLKRLRCLLEAGEFTNSVH